jgi:hypothetical protein
MSFLAPLYVLGALAIAAPILFHLIRRTTKGETRFSSLMFLTPSPPRLTRRSRIDQWLLLLLRAAVLILLAFAFARPFLRKAANLNLDDQQRGRIALLIDTSASMRRGDLWAKAKVAANEVISASSPGDQLAVFAFDESCRPLLSFEESATLDAARRQALARSLVDHLSPTWNATQLGQALIDAVTAIENVGDAGRKSSQMPRRIVLISDMQQGGRLETLGDFEWPKDVEIELKTVVADPSNAAMQWVTGSSEGDSANSDANSLGVRVSNQPGSKRELFELAWSGNATPLTTVYVPPGESRVARIPRPTGSGAGRTLQLKGDLEDFDNTLFLATAPQDEANVLYLGPDKPDDANGVLYYLNRVFEDTPRRRVRVESRALGEPLTIEPSRSVPLAVLTGETSPSNLALLRSFADRGGTVLVVVTAAGNAASLAALTGTSAVEVAEGAVRGDVLLSDIAFDHPLFAALSAPQFNDFTKIHFWKYRRIPAAALEGSRILARFESGDAAIAEKPLGKGRILIFASGWSPEDGQLARSSKFVPLMAAVLEGPTRSAEFGSNVLVGERVSLPDGARGVHTPDGGTQQLEMGATSFTGTDRPGVYTIDAPNTSRTFAVNLDPAESKTAPMNVETLEQLGCRLANPKRAEVEVEPLRQMQNAELESRQKLWRPIILAAIAILIVETWLAGWLSGSRSGPVTGEKPAS